MFSSISGQDIGLQFIEEAKRLLELEQGRASLPAIQGLSLLFSLSVYGGTDRAGLVRVLFTLNFIFYCVCALAWFKFCSSLQCLHLFLWRRAKASAYLVSLLLV